MNAEKRPRVPRGLKQDGPALWSYGFRPFFLGGAIWAVAAMVLWIAALVRGLPLGGDFGAPLWHAHEMLWGFAPAVLAGFLLTAVPNWTGSLPVSGRPLMVLAAVWAAGRIAMTGAGAIGMPLAAAIDATFLPSLLIIAGREIVAGHKWKDLKILAGCAAVMAGNIGFHASVLTGGDPQIWLRAAVSGYVVLILIIGGRIIPSFTRNWLARQGADRMPAAHDGLDTAIIAASALALGLWTVAPDAMAATVTTLIAAGLNAARLARWRGLAVRAEWLLVVLHGAYAFVPLGFLAIAAAGAGWLLTVSALHVLTVGVIGTMMLAVMTRATRGHTGRALTASGWTVASYLCLFAAALARPLADLTGIPGLMELSAMLWIAAFGLFLAEHGRMLVQVRRQTRAATA